MTTNAHLVTALHAPDPSVRLRAALDAGTTADHGLLDVLVQRCGVEPDFYVRDMLTWAVTRLPTEQTVPRIVDELRAAAPQARSQALHTLSKIGDRTAWPSITPALLHDDDDAVATAAWRAAVALAPDADAPTLAVELARELGRGPREVQRSLSRALVELDEAAAPALAIARAHENPVVRAHAIATEQLRRDPDSGFDDVLHLARRTAVGMPDAAGDSC
ncbi:HEAT repeat domain-containing protein [Gordonia sp. ABSL1-1]|uniref:HEAT repeat domain-containing protein n=1 Tax=Gordonia sp. ABSL1-1 TaxID=3053923 RepID=UPI002573D4B7|nr:HEAT repeat domain-containing protein [Gordonia sp. ABSL1-1]MDL9938238.1 HEAT repeat domain-containing protein [Gordonia sp. ABSL1-1]